MMTPHKPAVAILYGFCEGRALGKVLERSLINAGFVITNDAPNADIVIAHSGGCLLVPKGTRAQTIVLSGFTSWPGKPLALRMAQKIARDVLLAKREHRLRSLGIKTLWNGAYFWRMDRNAQMLRAYNASRYDEAKRVVVVRNRNDAFCTPNVHEHTALSRAAFVSLPGEHDDIWQNPDAYAALLRALR